MTDLGITIYCKAWQSSSLREYLFERDTRAIPPLHVLFSNFAFTVVRIAGLSVRTQLQTPTRIYSLSSTPLIQERQAG